MNRPIKATIRDKNHTHSSFEENKQSVENQFRMQKLNQITEHRTKAILGNKAEK